MKNFLNIRLYFLALFLMIVALLSACKKNSENSSAPPVITSVINYVASPNDTLLKDLTPVGQWVVLEGHNLKNVTMITFDGVQIKFNSTLFTDTHAIVQVPSVIPFDAVSASDLNTIKYFTTAGSTTFSYNIVLPPPTITGISNEDAPAGDSVKIYGTNFFLIKDFTYAGVIVPSFSTGGNGTYISFAVPAGIPQTGGIVSVTTKSGVASTVYKVEDFADMFQNWDNVNSYPWGCSSSNSSTDFPGNTGWYGVLNASNLPGNYGNWWEHGINMGNGQWVPASDISNSPANYAVKFEVSVPASTPWLYASIYVSANYGHDIIGLYNPWLNSAGAAVPFTTNGWQTVTIPLSEFRPNNGTGTPGVTKISDLVGTSGNIGMNFWVYNATNIPIPLFNAAIDNIRVVKIH